MTILITGAFGFVGSNLSAYLAEKGHELWALDLLRPRSGRNDECKNGRGACEGARGACDGGRVRGKPGDGSVLTQRRGDAETQGFYPHLCDHSVVAKRGRDGECENGRGAGEGGLARKGEKAERSPLNAQRSTGEGSYARCFDWEELESIPWREVDAVVHLAGKAHDTRNASDPQSYFDVNVGLTKKVVRSVAHYCGRALVGEQPATGNDSTHALMNSRTHELPKFIFFSSVKAVADRVESVLTEEAVPAPQTPYGQSKLEAEDLLRPRSGRNGECKNERGPGEEVQGACDGDLARGEPGDGSVLTQRRGDDETQGFYPHLCVHSVVAKRGRNGECKNMRGAGEGGFARDEFGRCYILRPCMIHGPGNKGNLNLLYGIVRKGVPWPLGAFENRRSFASIGNVCAVVEGLLTGDAAAGVYQVADDEALATNELIGLMAETLGRRARVWRVPAGLIRCAARCGDVLHLPLNSERLKKLSESYVVSNAKIKKALGWERMPVSARDGMRKTLESFGMSSLTESQRSQRSF